MPIQALQYRIRRLKRHEIEELLQLCKAEGRHMGTVSEVETWMQIDPLGFFVATNKEGQIIGSCCGMRLSNHHGYVGMYVVNKDYRGLGIGKQVWDAAMNHLGSRNNGLSAVSHLFTLYRDKAGFSQVADWTVNLYKLDNMAVIFHCKNHNLKLGKANGYKLTQSLIEYYKNMSNCHSVKQQCNNNFVDQFDEECNFFCLAQEYKNKERKYLRQIKTSKSIDFSDDESYGFSTLFFEDNSNNNEVNDLDQDSLSIENEMRELNKESDIIMQVSTNNRECCIKLRHYCNSYHCNNGKLRTIVIDPNNKRIIEDVVDYDRRMHTYNRSQIVRLTLNEKNCISRVALLGETVVGYGCVKPNLQNMWIISPLYADNEYVAKLLLLDLVTDHIFVSQYNMNMKTQANIVLKTPSNNCHAAKLLEELGFVKQEYTLRRCYTKQIFEVPTQSIYALHTSVFCTE